MQKYFIFSLMVSLFLFENLPSHETASFAPFFFIQMADCQLGAIESNISWEKDKDLLRKSVNHINRLKPRFVILCGDLTHAFPNEKMYPEQVRDYKNIVSEIDKDIPLICLCGNHDIGNTPTRETIATYESHFGPHYQSFWVDGVHCITLTRDCVQIRSQSP